MGVRRFLKLAQHLVVHAEVHKVSTVDCTDTAENSAVQSGPLPCPLPRASYIKKHWPRDAGTATEAGRSMSASMEEAEEGSTN